jgi:hypothetical protein
MNLNRIAFAMSVTILAAVAALSVPPAVQMPGTQPGEAGNLETPDKCDNCHGGYNRAVEPSFNWRGSMMANATRDPVFWATLAVAEQDFDGVGDMCLRCHTTSGWNAGRATPTDGSGLQAGDADGVECDSCHKMTNTDNTEHLGVMKAPFIANKNGEGFYGSGMLSRWPGSDKLGPYASTAARHQFKQSKFHRSEDFCGSCHDVSNAVTGDLAHNQGRQETSDSVTFSGILGSALSAKVAFNEAPYRYGVVERTFSEFKAGKLASTPMSGYSTLPVDLKAGAVKAAYDSSGGNYEDGTLRTFTCQTCHMRAVTGEGANKSGTPTRKDLPLHDMTGGNYWAAEAVLYQNAKGTLRVGGGLNATQIEAIKAGADRARQQLRLAASLEVSGNTLKVVNLTGHKLISGYPEGRRMWINVKWYDASGLVREDGEYGEIFTSSGMTVKTLKDLAGTNTKIYEAHYGMTKEWAAQLISLGYSPDLPLSFDRESGAVAETLGTLANGSKPAVDTFHFVLNNTVTKDNRIPPYGFDYEEARKRNALPTPVAQYGSPTSGGSYRYWDEVALNPPTGANWATISLMYQPTSWEYVQFLALANKKQNPFLAAEGTNLLDAWMGTGMAEPFVMASTTWGSAPAPACATPGVPTSLSATSGKKSITLSWSASNPAPTANGGYKVYLAQSGKLQLVATLGPTALTYKHSGLTSRVSYTYQVSAFNACGSESLPSTAVTATAN